MGFRAEHDACGIDADRNESGGWRVLDERDRNDPFAGAAGGYTFNVGYTGQVGIIGVPSTATIPEGQTSVAIPITTQIRSDHGRTADVHANTSGSPWIYTSATVSLRKTQPDLRAVTFNAPANTAPDVTMNFDWTVENIGLAATGANGGVDSVYFSLDQYPSYDDQWVTSLSNGALAAGASRTLSSTGSILPSSVPGPGDYYLIFTTNKDRSVVEGGEYQNNTIVRPIHVDLPDLVPENFSVPATVEPAVNYPVSWTVRNAGTVPVAATSYSQLYFSMDNVEGGADDVYIGTVTTAPLAAGASVVQSATARILTVRRTLTAPATVELTDATPTSHDAHRYPTRRPGSAPLVP
ncbi:MAG: hypothetical protein UZ17_ACD001000694 [Acidobacteria bacterium OLB17]|nr:MAG: hypothetical protein UZ17_ACD001000694 [Acidobacteria bacterium OLB17]